MSNKEKPAPEDTLETVSEAEPEALFVASTMPTNLVLRRPSRDPQQPGSREGAPSSSNL